MTSPFSLGGNWRDNCTCPSGNVCQCGAYAKANNCAVCNKPMIMGNAELMNVATKERIHPYCEGLYKQLKNQAKRIPSLLEIVKDRATNFSFLRSGYAFYSVVVEGVRYMYPVELADLQNATIFAEMKAITMMRYIRKALAEGTFVRENCSNKS